MASLLDKVRGKTEAEKAEEEKEDGEVLANSILNHQTNSIRQARTGSRRKQQRYVCVWVEHSLLLWRAWRLCCARPPRDPPSSPPPPTVITKVGENDEKAM